METKLTEYLPWWRVTSTYIMSFHKDVDWEQRRSSEYCQCIFYFNDATPMEMNNIYNGLKKGQEEGIFTEFDVVEFPLYDCIIIRKWRNENKTEENKLCWRKHNDPNRHYESYTIDEYDDGRKVLCHGEYEIPIETIEKLPKIN